MYVMQKVLSLFMHSYHQSEMKGCLLCSVDRLWHNKAMCWVGEEREGLSAVLEDMWKEAGLLEKQWLRASPAASVQLPFWLLGYSTWPRSDMGSKMCKCIIFCVLLIYTVLVEQAWMWIFCRWHCVILSLLKGIHSSPLKRFLSGSGLSGRARFWVRNKLDRR